LIAYLDSSALAQILLQEQGVELLDQRLKLFTDLACHELGYVEMRSAAWRFLALPHKKVSASSLRQALETLWDRIEIIQIDSQTIRRAGALAEMHQLRAFDAVHLAAAESLQRDVGRKFMRWISLDKALNRAASAIGLVDGMA
jgi:uncharacterized protein